MTSAPRSPVDGPYAWFRLAASLAIATVGNVGMWAVVLVLPDLQAEFGIVRADETVSGGERIYLAQLAHQLGLEPATVERLESEAATRIDAEAAAPGADE